VPNFKDETTPVHEVMSISPKIVPLVCCGGTSQEGSTLMHAAAANGHEQVVKLLITR
jgi:hypothetical protein